MNINSISNSSNLPDKSLHNGETVDVELVEQNESNATVKIKGQQINVKLSGTPDSVTFKAQVIKTAPTVELKIITQSPVLQGNKISVSPQLPSGQGTVQVNVIKSENGSILFETGGKFYTAKTILELPQTFLARITDKNTLELIPQSITNRGDVRSELMQLISKNPTEMAKLIGSVRINNPTAAEIKQLFKNSGLFFENKLAENEPLAGDNKFNAAVQKNEQQFQNITQFQLASLIINDGFSFFDSDEMEEDAIMRVRKEEYGISIHIKMRFTILGDTVLNIVPKDRSGSYSALVKTNTDITAELEKIKIDKLDIYWKKLTVQDKQIFDYRPEIMEKLGGMNLLA